MHKFFAWIKHNKFATVLLVIVIGFVLTTGANGVSEQLSRSDYQAPTPYSPASEVAGLSAPVGALSKMTVGSVLTNRAFRANVAPTPNVIDRMVVTNSSLSLVVKDVAAGLASAKSNVESLGGYMVNSSISRPEEGGNGTITLRIPTDKLDAALAQLKSQAVKVVSQEMTGTDVTDQYVDNETRLAILERNKARFEEIMNSATKVDDILKVQEEIFSLQSQIDAIKGQQNYLQQTAKMALVTLYLSTDELALPYAPAQAWRPEVIFKLAVRNLMGTLQGLGSLLIWLAVYSVIWLPVLLIIMVVVKRRKRHHQ